MKRLLTVLVAGLICAALYILWDAGDNDQQSALLDEDAFCVMQYRST